jgi:hypothetical protein
MAAKNQTHIPSRLDKDFLAKVNKERQRHDIPWPRLLTTLLTEFMKNPSKYKRAA